MNSAFRDARADEAAVVTSFVRRQYGESYREEFYDISWLKERMENGSLRFIFALADGKIAGIIGEDAGNIFDTHSKILQDTAACADACADACGKGREARVLQYILLVVDSGFRGRGLGRGLFQRLRAETKIEEWASVYGYCVTWDTVSQSFHAQAGFTACGLLLNRYFHDYSAENLTNSLKTANIEGEKLPKKRSNLILCLSGVKKNAKNLFSPEKYRPYIASVYENLGIKAEFAEKNEKIADFYEKKGLYTVINERKQRYCEAYVWEGGGDFEALLAKTLAENPNPLSTFNVFVNMKDRGASGVVNIAEKNGFFFTGTQPLAGNYEFLVFHKTLGLEEGYDTLKTHPAFAPRVAELRRFYER